MALMAVSVLAWPVMTTASVSGDTCFKCSSTSMPVMPGMRRSRMAASNVLFSSALSAARPSGQTVTSCPSRGSSERMNSCKDFSSSTNSTRRLLCGGVAKRLLLHQFRGLERQTHREGAAAMAAGTGRFDLASMLRDDPVAYRQTQAGPFPAAALGVKRLENVFEH